MPKHAVVLCLSILLAACSGSANNGDASNNGASNNGASNNGASNNGASNNGASNNGASNNGATNNGASNNGASNNGATNNGDVDVQVCDGLMADLTGDPVASAVLVFDADTETCSFETGLPDPANPISMLVMQTNPGTGSVVLPDESPLSFVRASFGILEDKRVGALGTNRAVDIVLSDASGGLPAPLGFSIVIGEGSAQIPGVFLNPSDTFGERMDDMMPRGEIVPFEIPLSVAMSGPNPDDLVDLDLCEGPTGDRVVVSGGGGICPVGRISNLGFSRAMTDRPTLFVGEVHQDNGMGFPVATVLSMSAGTEVQPGIYNELPDGEDITLDTDYFTTTFRFDGDEITFSAFTDK